MIKFLIFLPFILNPTHAKSEKSLYFKESYDEADKAFVEQFARLKKSIPKANIHQFRYSAGTIRSYFFPAKFTQESLLVMISGTHGIEGHTGSAVQRWLLDQKYNTDKTAVLMIHGLNIYGFKNNRRTNENNIDLNRNFILARSQFKPDDADYSKLNSFLNPDFEPGVSAFSQLGFLMRSLYNIALNSMESLRTSILKGQYTFSNGIFYGGNENEIQKALIMDLVMTYMKPYKKIFLIDLHTGYGERAKLHLFAGSSDEQNSQVLNKIFNKDEVDFADKKNFYRTEGDVISYFIDKIRLNVDAEISGITFEYGTMNSQKTLGSIESLRRIILENQNFHHPADEKTSAEIKSLYREMFYPSDESWRSAVLNQTSTRMKQVFEYLNR